MMGLGMIEWWSVRGVLVVHSAYRVMDAYIQGLLLRVWVPYGKGPKRGQSAKREQGASRI